MNEIKFNGEIAKKTKYEGYYATKSGKILSVKVRGAQGKLDYKQPRELAYKVDKDGYLVVTISDKLKSKKNLYKRVHRIIWETFKGDILDNLTIDHINNKRDDNRLENLQLLTREENARKAKKGKTSSIKGKEIIKLQQIFKLTIDEEEQGIFNRKDLAEKFDIKKWDIEQFLYKGKLTKKLKERNITLEKM